MSKAILIVDDSLTVRMDLTEAFEAAGLRAVPCDSLGAARQALAREEIGLVVLDVLLPDGDGVDFLKEIRSTSERATLPVLMLSGEAEVKDRIRGLKTGANEYVGKPYETRYVVAKARELLGGPGKDRTASLTVLIIDDSEEFRRALTLVLEATGYAVLTAEDGRTGLAMIADHRPDAVLVDGVLPDMDGATVIRRVRLDAATRAVPCLLLTTHEDGGAQLRALEAGADAFVRKDDDMEVVLARLGAVMRRLADAPVGQIASLSSTRKILAVDDSLTYLNELAEALRAEGYEVSLAHSGEEALELLAVQPVDCILMDLIMPGMGGKEACIRIKAATGVRDIPLILLTAHDDRLAMLDGLSAGADDYISKSSEFEVLCARVLAQIRRKQFEDENRRYREELLGRELEATEERAARILAEARAAMVDELERKIEERTRELEATNVERRHSERMASVGLLSASIAHEINNPLAVVTGNLGLLRGSLRELLDEKPTNDAGEGILKRLGSVEAPLGDAIEAAERVREIVRDLRIFARSDEENVIGPVDLQQVIESSIRMASNEIRHRARLVKVFGKDAQVLGNESRLGQVFLNLIANAAQAIPVGSAGRNEITVTTSAEGDEWIAVEIADTGVGIPEDKLARVFDPFFTTKAAGVGSGLGLAICQRLVIELGGSISVRSTVGKGTVFRVLLRGARAADRPVSEPTHQTDIPAAARRGRVLIVDDEPALCKTFERMLVGEHDVVSVTSAREAIDTIGAGDRFDAILSDLMMPDMTGMELHATLIRIVPDQAERMIFMSGGALTPDAVKFFHDQGRASLEKPFPPAALRKIVREALELGGSPD